MKVPPSREEYLDTGALEQWVWDAACVIRGPTMHPSQGFYSAAGVLQRLSYVCDNDVEVLAGQFGDGTPIMRFYVLDRYSWQTIRSHGTNGKLGEFITEVMREVAKLNPDLQDVLMD